MNREFSRSVQRLMMAALVTVAIVSTAVARNDDRNSEKKDGRPTVTISNFGKVTDRMYRGAQPKGEDFNELAAIGVKTIVDLRADNDRNARKSAEAAGLRYINLPLEPKEYPGADAATRFFEIVNNVDNGVVYVHCAGGRHRTGSMIAAYRMTIDGWNFDQAYKEMKDYDFYTSRGHGCYLDYVRDYSRSEVARQTPAPSTAAPAQAIEN